MTEEQKSAHKTIDAWQMFDMFTNEQLNRLLDLAGVKPCADRGLKLHQVLCVWFHGFIPNLTELVRLSTNTIKIGDPAKTKLCVNCKWYKNGDCKEPRNVDVAVSVVTGERLETVLEKAHIVRHCDNTCGIRGKWFIPNDTESLGD